MFITAITAEVEKFIVSTIKVEIKIIAPALEKFIAAIAAALEKIIAPTIKA